MNMQRNRDIRGFFAQKPKVSSPPPAPSPPSSQPSTAGIPSSPTTPRRVPVRAPLSRNDEIKGSDDEDSDDSLESLTDIIGKGSAPPGTYQRDPNTPKAKRIATGSGFHKSPLTLQNKQSKPKYSLKSLLDHARQDDATDESARRAQELLKAADAGSKDEPDEDEHDPSKMQETAQALLDDDNEDNKGDKFARALQRTQVDDFRKRYYFFNPDGPPNEVARAPFPKKAATGRWALLADASRREQEFLRGIPSALVAKGRELPDELFLWMLEEICVEKNLQLRLKYIQLASNCKDGIRRLVNGEWLCSMLDKIGGPGYSSQRSKVELTIGAAHHPGRDWSPLVSFLQLVTAMAKEMDPNNIMSVMQLLLRMSLDPIVSSAIGVRAAHTAALESLVYASPSSEKPWNSFEICSYMRAVVEEVSQRYIVIRLIPISSARLCDLRRRLALDTLFQNSGLPFTPSRASMSFSEVFTRLDESDFKVSHSTDYEELNALIALLDIVLDDGQALHAHMNPVFFDGESDTKFDAEIDHLAFKLKATHDKIMDNSQISRKEAKAALDSVGKRLTYSVRTRPPLKTSIFDDEPPKEEETSIPQRQVFMKNWMQRMADKKAENANSSSP